jgi:hypothetical protein
MASIRPECGRVAGYLSVDHDLRPDRPGWCNGATPAICGGMSKPEIAVLYEHPSWFKPLFAALERRGLSYEAVPVQDHAFDPAGSPPPANVVFNRIAMSSADRDPEHALFYAQALFEHWATGGARVVNGAALTLDASKARQLSLIARLGLQSPATRVVHRAADIHVAAESLRFPLLLKAGHRRGGRRHRPLRTRPERTPRAVIEGTTPSGRQRVTLVQEYARLGTGAIIRAETLDGRILYAQAVEDKAVRASPSAPATPASPSRDARR